VHLRSQPPRLLTMRLLQPGLRQQQHVLRHLQQRRVQVQPGPRQQQCVLMLLNCVLMLLNCGISWLPCRLLCSTWCTPRLLSETHAIEAKLVWCVEQHARLCAESCNCSAATTGVDAGWRVLKGVNNGVVGALILCFRVWLERTQAVCDVWHGNACRARLLCLIVPVNGHTGESQLSFLCSVLILKLKRNELTPSWPGLLCALLAMWLGMEKYQGMLTCG